MHVLYINRIPLGWFSRKQVCWKESSFSLYIFLCLWNIWVQIPVSPQVSGQQSTEHLLRSQQRPAQSSHSTGVRASLPPLPFVCLSDTWKKSSRKSSGLTTNTLIFEFAQKGLFLPEAWRGQLGPGCERLPWHIFPANMQILGFKAVQ